jgi:hypothetical protein
VTYLAAIGRGLALQAGIFNSLIGYDTLYAKDNLSYTRPWGADFTPYLMLASTRQYPFTPRLTGTVAIIKRLFSPCPRERLSRTPQFQIAYKATDRVSLKQTVLAGSHQSDTALWIVANPLRHDSRAPLDAVGDGVRAAGWNRSGSDTDGNGARCGCRSSCRFIGWSADHGA